MHFVRKLDIVNLYKLCRETDAENKTENIWTAAQYPRMKPKQYDTSWQRRNLSTTDVFEYRPTTPISTRANNNKSCARQIRTCVDRLTGGSVIVNFSI